MKPNEMLMKQSERDSTLINLTESLNRDLNSSLITTGHLKKEDYQLSASCFLDHKKEHHNFKLPAEVPEAILHRQSTSITNFDQTENPKASSKADSKESLKNRRGFSSLLSSNFMMLTWFGLFLTVINLFSNLKFFITFRRIYCDTLRKDKGSSSCSLLDMQSFIFQITFLMYRKDKFELMGPYLGDLKDAVLLSSIGFLLLFIFMFVLIRLQVRLNANKMYQKRRDRSISEYTIMLQKYSQKVFTQEEVEGLDFRGYLDTLLAQSGYSDDYSIVRKELASPLFTLKKLKNQRGELEELIEHCIKLREDKETFSLKDRRGIENLLGKTKKELKKTEKMLKRENQWILKHSFSHKKQKVTGKVVLLALSSRFSKDKILRAYQEGYKKWPFWCRPCRKKPKYFVYEGPEPSTAKWRYIGDNWIITLLYHFLTTTLTGLVSISVILMTVFISNIINSILETDDRGSLITTIIALQINLIQIIAKKILDVLCKSNRGPSDTIGMAIRVVGISTLKVAVLITSLRGLFAGKLSDMLLMNPVRAVFKSFLMLFVIDQLKLLLSFRTVKKYFLMLRFNWMARSSRKIMMTQKQLNEIFEKPKYPFDDMLSSTYYALTVEFLLSTYLPALSVLSVVYFVIKLVVNWFLIEKAFSKQQENFGTYFEHFLMNVFVNIIAVRFISCFLICNMISVMMEGHEEEHRFFQIAAISFYALTMSLGVIPWPNILRMWGEKWKKQELDARVDRMKPSLVDPLYEKSEAQVGMEFDRDYCFKKDVKLDEDDSSVKEIFSDSEHKDLEINF